jgi:hypothetical protein
MSNSQCPMSKYSIASGRELKSAHAALSYLKIGHWELDIGHSLSK